MEHLPGLSQRGGFSSDNPRGEDHLCLEMEMVIEGRCRRQSGELTVRSGSTH